MRSQILALKRARAGRKAMTAPEVRLWQVLRGSRVGALRFRRQHAIGSYILDFYCPEKRLAVEVDGEHHGSAEGRLHDRRRDVWLANQGIAVLRVLARDVMTDEGLEALVRDEGLEALVRDLEARGGWPPPPPLRGPPPPLRGGE